MSNIVRLPGIPTERTASATMPPAWVETFDRMWPEWVDAPTWADRLRRFEALLATRAPEHVTLFGDLATLAMLTAMLEQVAAEDIRTMEAAALYRLAFHATWRDSAMLWMQAAGEEAIAAFIESRPALADFAMNASAIHLGEDLIRAGYGR